MSVNKGFINIVRFNYCAKKVEASRTRDRLDTHHTFMEYRKHKIWNYRVTQKSVLFVNFYLNWEPNFFSSKK